MSDSSNAWAKCPHTGCGIEVPDAPKFEEMISTCPNGHSVIVACDWVDNEGWSYWRLEVYDDE